MAAKFGPAGNSESFYAAGNKSALDMPKWIVKNNLDLYEYQCGRGVKISDDSARALGDMARECNVELSIHAPYYISLSSVEEEKRIKSVDYILQTLNEAKCMGAKRIVVHSGSCGKITRLDALNLAKDTISMALKAADEAGFGDIHICPETMGKVNQLGNVSEVMKLCQIDERLIPTIDFGHVNAQSIGGLKLKEDFEAIFDAIHDKLGAYRCENFHAHYSRIEYTGSGEKKHHTFAEKEFEPEFDPIAEIMAERNLSPHIICESAGTQTEDSVEIKQIYLNKCGDLNV
ncbi:MAG: TIM barrel protein [Oscillospiraceae bacterium]